MKTFPTRFGYLYTEETIYDRKNPASRGCERYIKIFDSDNKYFDYFEVEYLEKLGKENEMDLDEVLEYLFDCCNFESVDVEELLENLGIDFEFLTDQYDELLQYMAFRQADINNLRENEQVNRIGNFWVFKRE